MKNKLKILFVLFTALMLLLGFTETANMVTGNWYQQFMPNIGNRSIADIFFLDSLTGWAVTPYTVQNDSVFVLKTSNGGDDWFKVYSAGGQFVGMNRIRFLDQNTGICCGVGLFNGSTGINKTTNGGINWFSVNEPITFLTYNDMSILNIDTIWLAASSNPTGGIYRTTNAGVNWTQQFSGGAQNPNIIYMFNSRIGFMANNTGAFGIYKTTNSGTNWNLNLPNESFFDIHFTDSLTGWFCYAESWAADTSVRKTTNGGLNWIKQKLPTGGIILTSQISKFSFISRDTIWGAGGQVFYGSGRFRAMLYRTTNGGSNWLFQVPDTSFGFQGFGYVQFINKNIAWAYDGYTGGIHSTNGGDTTFLTGLHQISNSIPKDFKLYQNYPNPFNPVTVISYQLRVNGYVKISVYDVTGKHIIDLVSQKQNSGTYQVDFSGTNYSSGVYFYSLYIDDKLTETKKMILLK